MRTLQEIRNNVANTTRESQINSLIDEYINLTLQEINDPGWAFNNTYEHLWSFNRRKKTLKITSEETVLPRDLDKISFIRQINSPSRLLYVPDDVFYRYIPSPTSTGTPLYYRLWEEEGVSTRLSTNDTIDLVSSSASDTSAFTVTIVGYSTTGYIQSEVYTLNGITEVTGTLTFDSTRPLRVSKSGKTTGYITLHEHTAGTTTVVLGPEERSPRFRILGVYPIYSPATGTITAVADYSATVAGTVAVTSASHGLSTGNLITIAGTTNYNGDFSITKIDDNTFYITETFVASETGTWSTYMNLYLEYYTRIRNVVNDADVPDIDEKWLWIVRLGAIAKIQQYQKKPDDFVATQALYSAGVRSMVKSDIMNYDYIPTLRNVSRRSVGVVQLDDNNYSLTF